MAALGDEPLDVLVVGGGIVGACVALEAVGRSLRVALVEQGDFGGGTTANCLKIVHGGLRYLQHLDLRRVRESTEERAMWLRSAPHLVEPLPVVLPTYRGGFPPRWALAAALAVNDAASPGRNRGVPADRAIPRGRVLSRTDVLALAPELEAPALTGGILFHDAIMYSPERVTLEVVAAARAAGATALNHVALESATVTGGRVAGARLVDRVTGEARQVATRWLVNATGASAPAVAALLTGRPGRAEGRYSMALNLVTRQPARATAFAVAAGPPDPDRVFRAGPRQLFVVPWREQTLIGTAHLPYRGNPSRFEPGDEHVAAFLAELAGASPPIHLDPDQLALVHRGLLPVADGRGGPAVRLLKRHRIVDHEDDGAAGAITIVSIKFTTARRAARDAIDRITRTPGAAAGTARPARLPLPGAPAGTMSALADEARCRHGDRLPADILDHLLRSYGSRYEAVLAYRESLSGWDERVVPGAPVIRAQLDHGVEAEMARTADDLLWRRTELGPRGLVTAAARAQAEAALARAGR
jgi:glycerol-3-phosphate dehydrogenase